jgi:hypothetical protein
VDAGHHPSRGGPSVADETQIRILAEAAVHGLPILRMYRSRDPEEIDLLEAVRKEAINVADDMRLDLARKIVQETADAQKRGEKNKGK